MPNKLKQTVVRLNWQTFFAIFFKAHRNQKLNQYGQLELMILL